MSTRALTIPACAALSALLSACASYAAPRPSMEPSAPAAQTQDGTTDPASSSSADSNAPPSAAPAAAESPGGWWFDVTPYVWLAGFDGTVGRSGHHVSIEAPPYDSEGLFQTSIDFALMGHFEFGKGDWTFFVNGDYVDLSSTASASRSLLHDVGATSADVDLDLTYAALESGAAWKMFEFDSFGGRKAPFELLGGARWNQLDVGMSLDSTTTVAEQRFDRTFDANFTASWVDPFVGARTFIPLFSGVGLSARGDVGGFGLGSDLAWNVVTGVAVKLGSSVDLLVGYRWYDVQFDRSGHSADLMASGLTLGVTIKF